MVWTSPALRQDPGAPQQAGEGALGCHSAGASSSFHSSRITPKGLQSPLGLFSTCQQLPLLRFRRQEFQTPLDWQQAGVSAALPAAGRLRANTIPRVGATGRAAGPGHNQGSLLYLKLQPKTSCWGMLAIQVDFGETINSPQQQIHIFPPALSQPLMAIPIQGGFVPDLRLGLSRNPLTTVPVAPAVNKPSKSCTTGGALFLFPLPLLWDERSFMKDFRSISLPSGHRRLLPSHRALDTHRVFCPGLKRTLFAKQSEQHVKMRRKKKKELRKKKKKKKKERDL